jgi:hypothetical protein
VLGWHPLKYTELPDVMPLSLLVACGAGRAQ